MLQISRLFSSKMTHDTYIMYAPMKYMPTQIRYYNAADSVHLMGKGARGPKFSAQRRRNGDFHNSRKDLQDNVLWRVVTIKMGTVMNFTKPYPCPLPKARI